MGLISNHGSNHKKAIKPSLRSLGLATKTMSLNLAGAVYEPMYSSQMCFFPILYPTCDMNSMGLLFLNEECFKLGK